jgi:hypothetical protein
VGADCYGRCAGVVTGDVGSLRACEWGDFVGAYFVGVGGVADDQRGRKLMRLAVTLPNQYPRKLVWWMECDTCHETRSRPAWTDEDLPLGDFMAVGWECGETADKCPKCIQKGDN